MKKVILKAIGIDENAKKQRIDDPLWMHLLWGYGKIAGLFVIAVIFAITSKQLKATLIFMLMVAALIVEHTITLLKISYGDYMIIEGPCWCTDRSRRVVKLLKQEVFGKATINVKGDNDKTYEMPLRSKGYPDGTKVKVYAFSNDIFKKDEDTFSVPNPIFILKTKNVDRSQRQPDQQSQTKSK